MTSVWDPRYEGIDHINVYSKSKLPLGRALSNFFKSNFSHPQHGSFASVEGFYYWLLSGEKYDDIRELHGFIAKRYGQNLPAVRKVDKKFKLEIQKAIAYKIVQNLYIQRLLIKSELPLAHYYFYGDAMYKPKMVDRYKEHSYMIHAIEEIRENLKKNGQITKSNVES
jgi:hypothetical protein